MSMNSCNTRFIGGIGVIPTLEECHNNTDYQDLGDYKKIIDAIVESDDVLNAYIDNRYNKPTLRLFSILQAARHYRKDTTPQEARLILFLLQAQLGQ